MSPQELYIAELYKSEKGEVRIFPDDDMWEWIQDDLDIQDIWGRIDLTLERRDRIQKIVKSAMKSIFAILLLASVSIAAITLMQKPDSQNNFIALQQEYTEEPAKKDIVESPQQEEQAATMTKPRLAINKYSPNSIRPLTDFNGVVNNGRTGISEVQILEPTISMMEEMKKRNGNDDSSDGDPGEWWAAADMSSKDVQGFYVGGIGGVKNQWLLSASTINSFKQQEPAYPVAVFSQTYGVSAGMVVNDKFNVQSDMFFITKNGLKQVDYEAGHSIAKEIQFGYYKLGLSGVFKKKMLKKSKLPVTNNFVLGVYGGWLRSGELIVDQELVSDISNDYRNGDFGLVGGYELSFLAGNHFAIAPGFRYHQGLMNIYKGTEEVPAEFNRTLNTSFELNLGLRYLFGSSSN